jgi:hypothetical protein
MAFGIQQSTYIEANKKCNKRFLVRSLSADTYIPMNVAMYVSLKDAANFRDWESEFSWKCLLNENLLSYVKYRMYVHEHKHYHTRYFDNNYIKVAG